MNPQIYEEVTLVVMSLYGGLVMAVSYDCIRIFRKIIKPSIIRVIMEDFIYWVLAAYFAFGIIIKYNYGRLRAYPIAGMILAMAVYEIIIGRKLVNILSSIINKIVNTLLKPLKKVTKRIKLVLINQNNEWNRRKSDKKSENHKSAGNSEKKSGKKSGNKVKKWQRGKKEKTVHDIRQPHRE